MCRIKHQRIDVARFRDAPCRLVVDISLPHELLCHILVGNARHLPVFDARFHQLDSVFILVFRHFKLHGMTISIEITIRAILERRIDGFRRCLTIFALNPLAVHHAIRSVLRIVIAENLR